jgi:hypothetical protein
MQKVKHFKECSQVLAVIYYCLAVAIAILVETPSVVAQSKLDSLRSGEAINLGMASEPPWMMLKLCCNGHQ